ncbi:MAG: cobalamin-binding protein, partial [Anaerolineae bacterium]|nr:cobalamin-binding protein [Anaerolineae bacterium]
RPDWVIQKVWETNQVFFEAYDRIYDIIKLEDGSSVFGAFHLWGPGKVAKVQCDTSAMFSPAMFETFVVPALTAQCTWLDYSMFHLDGHQCIKHLELLLAIDSLDAIEWTPDPQVPSGGHPRWYPMYRRILEAGKSVQAIGVKPEEVIPLLDALGGKGMYIMTRFEDREQAEKMQKLVEPYR